MVIRYSQKEKQYSTKHLSQYFRADELPPEFHDDRQEFSEYVKEQCDKCLVGILHCLDNDSRLAYIMRDITGINC